MYRVLLLLLISLTVSSAACDQPSPVEANEDALPPDPGEEGKTTLGGIDSDGDGVRDDVQRYIYLNYQDQPTREALIQFAQNELRALEQASDASESLTRIEDMMRAMECLYSIRSDDAAAILVKLEPMLFNTMDRVDAYFQSERHAGGEVFNFKSKKEWTSSCK